MAMANTRVVAGVHRTQGGLHGGIHELLGQKGFARVHGGILQVMHGSACEAYNTVTFGITQLFVHA